MKFDWATVVTEMRQAMLAATTITGKDRAHTLDLTGYFRITMRQTDTFHPFEFDHDLDRAFSEMPAYCNYRSCEALKTYRRRRDLLADAVFGYLEAMQESIDEHFRDGWNFPPGYQKPVKIEYADLGDVALKVLPSVIRRAQVSK